MTSIFNLIFSCMVQASSAFRGFEFTVYGFRVNMFDFMLVLFLLSSLLPLFFIPNRATVSGLGDAISRSSERIAEQNRRKIGFL